MRVSYTDCFVLPLPERRRFPIEEYALVRERVVAARRGGLRFRRIAAEPYISPQHSFCPLRPTIRIAEWIQTRGSYYDGDIAPLDVYAC